MTLTSNQGFTLGMAELHDGDEVDQAIRAFSSIVSTCGQQVDAMEDNVDLLNCLLVQSNLPQIGHEPAQFEAAIQHLSREYELSVPALRHILRRVSLVLGLDPENRIFVVYVRYVYGQRQQVEPVFVTSSKHRADAYVRYMLEKEPAGQWTLDDIWYVQARKNVVYPGGMHLLPRQQAQQVEGDPADLIRQSAQQDQTFVAALTLDDQLTTNLYRIGDEPLEDAEHNVLGRYDHDYVDDDWLINSDPVGDSARV